jgi:hypothetical protein
MTIDAARIYPDRALSYEFEPLDEINESYIEEEFDYQGGEWIVPQVRVVVAHGYQASIYLFSGQTAETVEGQTAETVEPWQALSPSSGLVQVE